MTTLDELFEVRNGNSLALNKLELATRDTGIAFVSRKEGDNGIAAYVAPIVGLSPNPAGDLSCALSGNGVLSTFVQDGAFYTAYHVACLRPRESMTNAQKLYYCACIFANRYRYGWGRQANRSLRSIKLPSPSKIPKWVEEAADVTLNGKQLPSTKSQTPAINTATWARFKLSDLFEIKKGKRLTRANMTAGETPFIGAIDSNNGFVCRISQSPLHPAGTITVNYNGNGVAEAFYQPEPYRCSDDVNVLYPRGDITPAAALFLATVIRQEKYRFNYGRKWHLERMEVAEIRLPALASGKPDWRFMERYIKTLPFSSQV